MQESSSGSRTGGRSLGLGRERELELEPNRLDRSGSMRRSHCVFKMGHASGSG